MGGVTSSENGAGEQTSNSTSHNKAARREGDPPKRAHTFPEIIPKRSVIEKKGLIFLGETSVIGGGTYKSPPFSEKKRKGPVLGGCRIPWSPSEKVKEGVVDIKDDQRDKRSPHGKRNSTSPGVTNRPGWKTASRKGRQKWGGVEGHQNRGGFGTLIQHDVLKTKRPSHEKNGRRPKS